MEEPEKKTIPPETPKTPKKGGLALWKKLLAALLAVVIILTVLLLGAEQPYRASVNPLSGGTAVTFSLMVKLHQLDVDSRQEPPVPLRLTLDPEELNALLNLGLAQYEDNRTPDEPTVNGAWKEGIFDVLVSHPVGCGLALNFAFGVVPELRDGQPQLRLTFFRVGSLPVPCSLLQGVLDREVRKRLQKPQAAAVLALLKAVESDAEEGVTLEFVHQGWILKKLLKR